MRALVFSVLVRCICQELGPVDYLLLHGCVALHYLSELSILGLPTRMKVILLSFAFYDSQAIFAIKFLRGCLFFWNRLLILRGFAVRCSPVLGLFLSLHHRCDLTKIITVLYLIFVVTCVVRCGLKFSQNHNHAAPHFCGLMCGQCGV